MPDTLNPRTSRFMAPFGGLDRLIFDPDPDYNKQKRPRPLKKNWGNPEVRSAWILDWFHSLYRNSNFYITGVYLNSKEADPNLVTKASRTEHYWTRNWSQIEQQGWGIWALYQGFSNSSPQQPSVRLPADWETTSVRRGVAAAQHIAAIAASKLHGDITGMVVYIDNEEGTTKVMLSYYRALFGELQTLHHDGRPPLRAGLYIRDDYIKDILSEFPDLYIWLINTHDGDLPKVGDRPYPTPIERVKGTGRSESQRFLNERYPITLRKCPFLPVGRQCTLQGAQKGYTQSVIVGVGEEIMASISGFDFDVSFVRDPRYPHADPRFVCMGADQIVYSTFEKSGMRTAEVGSEMAAIQNIEPEAPLVAVDQELYSIDRSGNIIVSIKRPTTLKLLSSHRWDPSTIVVPKGDLRRIRTFNVIRISTKETLLFYISSEYKIQAYRRVQLASSDVNAKWTRSDMVDAGNLHPFTNMSTALFKNKLWLFFMQVIENEMTEASLHVAQWRGSGTQQLGRGLKGTTIVAIATTTHIVVFFIGKDCQLWFAFAYEDPNKGELKWSKLITPAASKIKLHPHTRISACIVGPTLIKVAVISSDGIPSTYDIRFNQAASAWVSVACTQYPHKENGEMKSLKKGLAVAKGWTVNPYGDIALLQNGQVELYCVGAAPDKRGILLHRLKENEPWLRLDIR